MENTDIQVRIQQYEAELKALQDKYSLKTGISLEFPQYKKLPEELQLALLIIQKHEYKFMLSYEDLRK